MQEILQTQPDPEQRKPLPLNILLGALVVIAVALSFWFAFRGPAGSSSRSGQSDVSIPMSQAEMIGMRIEIENMAIRREENFLHQEVTVLDADLINAAGQHSIRGLTFTFEFFDDLHQIVLRETRSVLAPPSTPVGPGQRRSISTSFDRLPPSWNRQQPSMRVAYVQIDTLN